MKRAAKELTALVVAPVLLSCVVGCDLQSVIWSTGTGAGVMAADKTDGPVFKFRLRSPPQTHSADLVDDTQATGVAFDIEEPSGLGRPRGHSEVNDAAWADGWIDLSGG